MTFREAHLTHDEIGTPTELAADCRVVHSSLRLERAAQQALSQPPSLEFASFGETGKPEIRVSDAAARLAAALELHL